MADTEQPAPPPDPEDEKFANEWADTFAFTNIVGNAGWNEVSNILNNELLFPTDFTPPPSPPEKAEP